MSQTETETDEEIIYSGDSDSNAPNFPKLDYKKIAKQELK